MARPRNRGDAMTKSPAPPKSPHTIVRASAGSGKTYRLTNEFMARLIDGHEPGSILATTFTRVAAGEILHRVLDRLSAAVIDDQGLGDLAKALEKPNLTKAQCSKVLSNLINHLHRLSIMTIDSFFSRMASSFSFELGLPMQYRLIEEDEDQDLREQSVDQTINQCTNAEMVELLRSMQGDQVKLQTHSAIMQAIKSGYNMYLATNGNPDAWNAINPIGQPMTDSELKQAAEQLATASIPTTKAGAPSKRWLTPQQKCVESIESKAWDAVLGGGLGSAILKTIDTDQAPTYYNTEFPQDLQDILTPIVQHARHALSLQHNARTLAIFNLMARFDQVYRETKMSTGQLCFDDPPRLLNESRITGQLEHLYYRLDTRLSHIMLDEFQDTSMPQFTLIKPILDELLSQDTDDRSVFVVGDIKQSLYTWRQAEPKLLGAMKDHWETLNDESMADSWRSSPIVLNAVNDIFGDLPHNMAMRYKEVGIQAADNWDQQYGTHNAAEPNKNMPGYASLAVADEPEDEPENIKANSEEIAEAMYWSCATHVQEAKAQSPDATIAILVRQTKHIYPLLAKLSALDIEACENRGNPLVDAPSVAAAVSMLQLIDHPSDTAALHHVQSTPLAKALRLNHPNDIHPIAANLRHRAAAQGCVPLLIEWLNACADAMDQRGQTRFKQLIDLAGHLQDQGDPSPATLASIAQNRKIDDPAQAPVRVLTIHGSKGLEFDVVVLPLFETQWKINHENILAMRDQALGPISKVTRYPDQTMQQVHPALKELHDDSMLKQINEELCCLYVATTRAKSSLQMIVPADKEGRSNQPEPLSDTKYRLNPAHVIRSALAPDQPATPGSILWESSAGNWTDNIKSKAETTAPTTPVTLNLIAPSTLKAGQLTTAAPSTLHEETTQTQTASDLLDDSRFGQSARDFGQCVHNAFEQFDWADQSIPTDEQITRNLADQGHSPSHITQSLKILHSSLQNQEIAALLNHDQWLADHPKATSAAVHHERPFAQRLGQPERLVQGRFDRLIIGRNNTQITNIHIIDYKTDHAAAGLDQAALNEYAQKHLPQMNAYRQAIKSMYNLDDDAIEVTLIFTSAPAIMHL